MRNRVPRRGVVPHMKLKVRVVQYRHDRWYADIDDAEDRQPDDPFWYAVCATQAEAIALACAELATLDRRIADGLVPARISQSHPVAA
ncbi:hypothetical protein [Kribbella sp. NPDC048915]|uniref:hypothetical protein n=1 Tax=Kribbella sp. NPDC048915 TaxID=3155148 RepID=UPI0033E59A1A